MNTTKKHDLSMKNQSINLDILGILGRRQRHAGRYFAIGKKFYQQIAPSERLPILLPTDRTSTHGIGQPVSADSVTEGLIRRQSVSRFAYGLSVGNCWHMLPTK